MIASPGLSFARPRRSSRIGLTSLIDVVFMLLMFFMLATSFDQWRSFELATAATDASLPLDDQQQVVLRVYPDYIDLDGRRIDTNQLSDALNAVGATSPVLVKPMVDTHLQRIVTVMDRLRLLGISNLVISIE